ATYSITPPGGSWDQPDNGLYSVVMQPNQVSDTSSNFITTDLIGQFTVGVPLSLVVTSAADDGSPGTLRDALTQANTNANVADAITFDTGKMGTNTIALASPLTVSDSVSINGGAGIILDGGGSMQIMQVSGPGQLSVGITGVTFQNGYNIVTGV